MSNNYLHKKRSNKIQDRISLSLILFYLCLPVAGILPTQIVSILLMLLMFSLIMKDEFYYLYPACIVYYSYLYVPFTGLSLYRLYSLVLLVKILIRYKFKLKKSPQLAYAIILTLYMLIAVMFVDIRTAIFGIVDILVIYLLVMNVMYQKDNKHFEKIIGAFTIACVASVLTGLTAGNTMSLSYEISGSWRATNRFNGTFVDPNYCSLMYILAIAGILAIKPFKKVINMLLMVTLGIGIAMTISFTGFIGLVITVLFYLILTKQINMKTFCIIVALIIGLSGLFYYGTINTDAPVIGDIVYRINSYVLNYESSSNGGLAVSRITIYQKVFDKFKNQNLLKIIFGMNVATPQISSTSIETVAHNDYMDTLYNLGVIFTTCFYSVIIYRFIKHIMRYRKYHDKRDAFIATTKVIWLYYSFVLTMLTERIFYLCLFI